MWKHPNTNNANPLVGGPLIDNQKCGYCAIYLMTMPQLWYIGTSNKYTLDGLWWSIDINHSYLCVGSRTRSRSEHWSCGVNAWDVSNWAQHINARVGAFIYPPPYPINTLQMVSGGMEQEFDMALPVVILTLGFGAAVPSWVWTVLLVTGTGVLVPPSCYNSP